MGALMQNPPWVHQYIETKTKVVEDELMVEVNGVYQRGLGDEPGLGGSSKRKSDEG